MGEVGEVEEVVEQEVQQDRLLLGVAAQNRFGQGCL